MKTLTNAPAPATVPAVKPARRRRKGKHGCGSVFLQKGRRIWTIQR
jgi:hypothetical protein